MKLSEKEKQYIKDELKYILYPKNANAKELKEETDPQSLKEMQNFYDNIDTMDKKHLEASVYDCLGLYLFPVRDYEPEELKEDFSMDELWISIWKKYYKYDETEWIYLPL